MDSSAVRVGGALALPATSAQAAFPGANGRIAWTHPTGLTTDSEVFIMNADGSDKRPLTNNDRNDFPAWSPDGQAMTRTGSRCRSNRRPLTAYDGGSTAPATRSPGTAGSTLAR